MTHPDSPSDFEALFDRLYPMALRLAGRLVGATEAEDVAAEAFARALARWGKVAEQPNVDAWVLRVTANVALDELRRKRRQLVKGADPCLVAEEASALRVTLTQALRTLSRRQSEVLALRFFAGLNEQEVAGALGISLGSVKTHARRGLATMRLDLGPDKEELFDAR
jgi:RNA polymerase sigma-70 factor (ECF subfamily)